MPFTEGAQYGIELFYPYDNDLRVAARTARWCSTATSGPIPVPA